MEFKELSEMTAVLIKRFYELSCKARRNNFSQLKSDIDASLANCRDVFEYGLLLFVNGIEAEHLGKILNNLINLENDKEKRKYKLIQKEAVMHIQKGSYPKLFYCALFSYFNTDEINEVQSFLNDTIISEDIKSLLEKPFNKKEVLLNKQNDVPNDITPPFEFLNNVDDNTLLDQIKQEQPQIIAFVLVLIKPKKAAFILSNLSSGLQSEVSYRIAVMGDPDFELIFDVLRFGKKILSLSGKKYFNPYGREFNKLLKSYLVRDEAINKAQELYEKAAQTAAGSREAEALVNNLISVMQGRAIDFIKTDPVCLFRLLQEEHPKTITCILSVLEPAQASLLLQYLQQDIQCETARRIALMDKSSPVKPEFRRDLGEISFLEIRRIEKKLSAMFNKTIVFEGGIKKLTELVLLADPATQKTIIDFICGLYPQLAGTINDHLFTFEDIAGLADGAIQKILREAESDDLAAALKNASDNVKERIFKNMSKRAVVIFKEEMDCMKPVSMDESAEAKKRIIQIIRRLEDIGEIVVKSGEYKYV